VQPLAKNLIIDNIRQPVATSLKSREISELGLLETLDNTSRIVQNAYWDLAVSIASFDVQQQSLDLARQSLRNTKARVEIGVQAPIDIVAAEAEVAQREESSIVAEAQVDRARDSLRTLIYDPETPNFWTIRLVPADEVPFEPIVVDIEAAVRKALDERTDLQRTNKNLETNDINIRYFRNQLLPEINAQFDYGLTAIGGTQLLRAPGFLGAVIGESVRNYSTILESIVRNEFPTWTFAVNVSYPLGTSQAEAQLARARLQQAQSQTQLKNQELQVASQVRDLGRQVTTNRKRVETTRAARALAQRRLEAEQKKFTAGTSTSFFVFQAQRDLSEAQSNELRAVLDYNKSVVDFETVQRSPLSAGSGSGVTVIN
jgi:outer membrane protein TolC